MEVSFSTAKILENEMKLVDTFLSEKNIEMLICHYPLKKTQALDLIAKKSSFDSRGKYEGAVRKMLIDSKDDLGMVRTLIQPATDVLLNHNA